MTQNLAVRQDAAEFAEESESRPSIVVTGRRVVVPEHFREHVAEKLLRLEKFNARCHRIEVELAHESNPRQSKHCQRVQVTMLGSGPVVRAEARAENFYAALELAGDKLAERLRRSKERRQAHSGPNRAFPAQAEPGLPSGGAAIGAVAGHPEALAGAGRWDAELDREPSGPGQIVRTKSHTSEPMAVEDALNQMELVGHDFYLFQDAATGLPSVVYRRRGYDYGLIQLE